MVFLVRTRIRAYGTSGHAPLKEAQTAATVLFHPDFNRRLRSCTESADPSRPKSEVRRSRAWARLDCSIRTLTAGGDFHPALRTSPSSMDGVNDYDQTPAPGQAPRPWGTGMSPMRQPGNARGRRPRPQTGRPQKVNHCDEEPIRFRFVLSLDNALPINCGRAPLWLWTDSPRRCGDSANHIS
jgi:hypothetical protein